MTFRESWPYDDKLTPSAPAVSPNTHGKRGWLVHYGTSYNDRGKRLPHSRSLSGYWPHFTYLIVFRNAPREDCLSAHAQLSQHVIQTTPISIITCLACQQNCDLSLFANSHEQEEATSKRVRPLHERHAVGPPRTRKIRSDARHVCSRGAQVGQVAGEREGHLQRAGQGRAQRWRRWRRSCASPAATGAYGLRRGTAISECCFYTQPLVFLLPTWRLLRTLTLLRIAASLYRIYGELGCFTNETAFIVLLVQC